MSKMRLFPLPPRALSPYNSPNSAKSVPTKYVHFQPARLVKGKRMYVEFRYRKEDGTWKRFRIFENINRYKSEEYAKELTDEVNRELEKGFNPFVEDPEKLIKPVANSLNKELDNFLAYCDAKGLRPKTISAYKISVNLLRDYFLTGNKIYQPPASVEQADMEAFLNDNASKKKWSNRTYNNYLSDISTIFKWLVKKKKIPSNPLQDIEPKNTIATKNRYYDDATAEKVKALMRKENPYLLYFFSTIYYCALRPKSEARFLQCKHILWSRKLLFVPGAISKNKKDDYIPLCDEMISLLKEMGCGKAEGDDYIFTSKGQPGEKPASANYFSNQFQPIKKKLKLGNEFTLYGAKHLRAIHLAQDGINPYELMRLFRHSSLEITMSYLRDLGIADNSEITLKTRKF